MIVLINWASPLPLHSLYLVKSIICDQIQEEPVLGCNDYEFFMDLI
jgi:hypothetical protein